MILCLNTEGYTLRTVEHYQIVIFHLPMDIDGDFLPVVVTNADEEMIDGIFMAEIKKLPNGIFTPKIIGRG